MAWIAEVGRENAAWLAANIGPAQGNPPVFRDLEDGRVEVLDMDAATALSDHWDGVIAYDLSNPARYILFIEGEGYRVVDV